MKALKKQLLFCRLWSAPQQNGKFSFVFQPTLNKEGRDIETTSQPPPPFTAPVEQRPRSASPVQKPRDSPAHSPPLSTPSRRTESEVESLLEEPQKGLPGETQNNLDRLR